METAPILWNCMAFIVIETTKTLNIFLYKHCKLTRKKVDIWIKCTWILEQDIERCLFSCVKEESFLESDYQPSAANLKGEGLNAPPLRELI